MTPLRIGTRGSPLALWQARQVAAAISRHDGRPTTLVRIETSGDRLSRASISSVGGKRLFVKEIEDALVGGHIDLAVHSAKDLPAVQLDGLALRVVLPREDPRDAVVGPNPAPSSPPDALLSSEPPPRIGTGSVRRAAQLRHHFPRVQVAPVRGNVGTRLRKLDEGAFDLLVLATAGLVRLELNHRITARLPYDLCVPAPGQGIVVAEFRANDAATAGMLDAIADADAAAAFEAERTLVTALGADCQVPLGAIARPTESDLTLVGVVATPDGRRLLRRTGRSRAAEAAALGRSIAQQLIADGAADILAAARLPPPCPPPPST